MSTTRPEDDVLELLESLDNNDSLTNNSNKLPNTPLDSSSKETNKEEDDLLGFLESLTENPKTTSSQLPSVVSSIDVKGHENGSNLPLEASDETTSSSDPTFVDQSQTNFNDPISSLTSWWSKSKGGIWNSATTAVKQAEARVREFQPEVSQTQKQAMNSLNDSISKFKLSGGLLQSTLSSVLETIVPPISRHERLQIHVFHDMVGYPSIDNIVNSVFERVMQQVEGGGELTMIVQKGREGHRKNSDLLLDKRELNIFKGSIDYAQKLAAASIEEFLRNERKDMDSKTINENQPNQSNLEDLTVVCEDGRVSTEHSLSVDGPASRISNIYLSIQPSSTDTEEENTGDMKPNPERHRPSPIIISSSSPRTFQFTIYLKDPEHNIEFSTVSQSFPLQWAEWLDSPDSSFGSESVDPRDWVIDWVEEGLGLSIGVLAQTYVSKRMGLSDLPLSRGNK